MSEQDLQAIRIQGARTAWSIILLAAMGAANGDERAMAGAVNVLEGQIKVLRELGVVPKPAATLEGGA